MWSFELSFFLQSTSLGLQSVVKNVVDQISAIAKDFRFENSKEFHIPHSQALPPLIGSLIVTEASLMEADHDLTLNVTLSSPQ